MERIVKGSIELLPVELFDRLRAVNSLDGFTVSFKVTNEDETADVVAWSACTNQGMRALPLVDTTIVGFVEAIYKLYVKVDIPPEHPVVGPFEFEVV